MENTPTTDIAIAGGGLNGATLALALARDGFDVTLVDPVAQDTRAAPGFDGRAYALADSCRAMLQVLGLWSDLADMAQPITAIRVSDGRAGEGPSPHVLGFDAAELDGGPLGVMVEDRHLRPALLAALDATPGITRIDGAAVADHAPDASGVTVTLDDGRTVRAGLLVGCDGRSGRTAERAGIRRIGWAYPQAAMVAAIAHERPHGGVAHQFFMPEGPLAILPLRGDRSSIVWTERAANAADIAALDDDAFLDHLRPRFGSFMGDIALAGKRYSYPLHLSLAQGFVAPRTALVGDAAHAVHPIAGQGLNAGLKDVAALAQVLVEARRRGEDWGRPDVLDRYQRWRRFDTAVLAVATDGFNRLFSNDNPVLRVARDAGLGAVNAWPGLRRAFLGEAAGLTGDRPNLLRGKPI